MAAADCFEVSLVAPAGISANTDGFTGGTGVGDDIVLQTAFPNT
jgi:hypothetical protein